MLAPVPQRDAAQVQRHAESGTRGAGGHLPYLDRIQAAFGHHDVSGVQAYVGGASKAASSAIGAEAYASGNKVAFAAAPDLHTAAHEAAHVIQQRNGVSVAGGVGQAGDCHEQHADQVADRVVQGKGAADLLGARRSGAGTAAVQMRPSPHARAPSLDVGLVHASPAAEPEVACAPGDDLIPSETMDGLTRLARDARGSVDWGRANLELGVRKIDNAFGDVQTARTKPDDTKAAERHRQLIEAEAKSDRGFLSIVSTIGELLTIVGAFRTAISAIKALATFSDVASAAKNIGVAVPSAAKSKAADGRLLLATTAAAQTKTIGGAAAPKDEAASVQVDRMAEGRLTELTKRFSGLTLRLADAKLGEVIGDDLNILEHMSAAPSACRAIASALAIQRACGRHAIAPDQARLVAELEALDVHLNQAGARYAYFSDLLKALGAVIASGDQTPLDFVEAKGQQQPGLRSLFEAVRANPRAYVGQVELIRAHDGYKVQLGPEFRLERGIDDHPTSEGPTTESYSRAHIPVRLETFVGKETFHLRTTSDAGAEVVRLTLNGKAQASSTGLPEVELTPSEAAILLAAGIPASQASANGAIVRLYAGGFTDLAMSFGWDDAHDWWEHSNLTRFVQTYPAKFKAQGSGDAVPSDASIEMEKAQ